jgi:hypothetical protein
VEENLFNNAEAIKQPPVLDYKEYEVKPEDIVPNIEDSGWSDYVISQLEPDESYNGLPTTDGLRRIAGKLLGPIVKSISHIVQVPTPENENHATVEHLIAIRWDDNPLDIREFQDVADTYPKNTPQEEFAIHAPATAATKAEGRALRKALQLKRIFTVEEAVELPESENNKINNSQIAFVRMMCERNDINVNKLLAKSKVKKYDKLEEVPYVTAVQITKYLQDCQLGKVQITDDIKGYDPNWRGTTNEG